MTGLINQIVALKCGFILADLSEVNVISRKYLVSLIIRKSTKNIPRMCEQEYNCEPLHHLNKVIQN